MKSIEEQRADKATRIAELVVEQAACIAKALNPESTEEERQSSSLRAVMIQEMEIPLVLETPIQRNSFPKGGMEIIGEQGPELIFQAHKDGNFNVTLKKGDKIVRNCNHVWGIRHENDNMNAPAHSYCILCGTTENSPTINP